MVKVAIAGGTGGLGRMIAEMLEASSEHTHIVLTRKVRKNRENERRFPNSLAYLFD
jgi:NAD dependent epimerase/dehydratase family enzyme